MGADAEIWRKLRLLRSVKLVAQSVILAPYPTPTMAAAVLETVDIALGFLTKEIIAHGVGAASPQKGDSVTAHYTGRLLDGTVFDSSITRGQPFKVRRHLSGGMWTTTAQPAYCPETRGTHAITSSHPILFLRAPSLPQFNIGNGEVIRGWDEGFATMKKGEKVRASCGRGTMKYSVHVAAP